MSPELEQIYVRMIRACLHYQRYETVCKNFGVSKSFLRKKCGWRSGRLIGPGT